MGIQTCIGIDKEVRSRFIDYRLVFKKPATTSRNTMLQHLVKYLILEGPQGIGIGEYAPIPGLSMESDTTFHEVYSAWSCSDNRGDLSYWRLQSSAFCFALEAAWNSYHVGLHVPFPAIPINGLVWMNQTPAMWQEANALVHRHFDCIKFKVGALDWNDELELIRSLRKNYPDNQLIIRVDANGAFSPDSALSRLQELHDLKIHSIEQPIKKGQGQQMAHLCQTSPIPIALDEELIGVHAYEQKRALLESIQPAYLVLKPTLHGGLQGCDEWIQLAQAYGIGWWVTSALESNIGLYAIASWVAKKMYIGHQGLGTGSLYTNNVDSPLRAEGGYLCFDETIAWDLSNFHLA